MGAQSRGKFLMEDQNICIVFSASWKLISCKRNHSIYNSSTLTVILCVPPPKRGIETVSFIRDGLEKSTHRLGILVRDDHPNLITGNHQASPVCCISIQKGGFRVLFKNVS